MIEYLQQTWLEIAGVICGLLYLVLMIKENIWCWIFGIVGSLITVIVFFETKLYLEAGLNAYYVLAGFYGWYFWKQNRAGGKKTPPVVEWKALAHILNIIICTLAILLIGNFMANYTDSPRPYFDTSITVFGISATILEARKILSGWIYWFFINGFSIWLQYDREIYFYALLSAFYTVMCIKGYMEWRKSYKKENNILT